MKLHKTLAVLFLSTLGIATFGGCAADAEDTDALSDDLVAGGSQFAACFDHGNDGAPPASFKTFYEISKNRKGPYLVARDPREAAGKKVFKLIIEDVRFTTYKCWDAQGNITGFDAENLTEAASRAGYKYIEFVPRVWSSVDVNGTKRVSLLVDLNNKLGDAVTAGMSMTPDRQEFVDMVGPIYKAGKGLMARTDNPKITDEKFAALQGVPAEGVEALRGLSVIVSGADIRGAYFRKMKEKYPDMVEYLKPNAAGTKFLKVNGEKDKLVVYEVEFKTINEFVDAHMKTKFLGRTFDLVMFDTGSTKSLTEEGKLGVDTRVVTGNLSSDPDLGTAFGTGDGISFRKDDTERSAKFRSIIGAMIREGKIDKRVEKWFQDTNSADTSWANGR